MTPDERQHAYEIECVIEYLTDGDDPFAIHEDLYAEAERIVAAKRTGQVMPYTYLVILDYNGRHIAVTPDESVRGCEHTGQSASMKWARIEAIREHQQQCLGR